MNLFTKRNTTEPRSNEKSENFQKQIGWLHETRKICVAKNVSKKFLHRKFFDLGHFCLADFGTLIFVNLTCLVALETRISWSLHFLCKFGKDQIAQSASNCTQIRIFRSRTLTIPAQKVSPKNTAIFPRWKSLKRTTWLKIWFSKDSFELRYFWGRLSERRCILKSWNFENFEIFRKAKAVFDRMRIETFRRIERFAVSWRFDLSLKRPYLNWKNENFTFLKFQNETKMSLFRYRGHIARLPEKSWNWKKEVMDLGLPESFFNFFLDFLTFGRPKTYCTEPVINVVNSIG